MRIRDSETPDRENQDLRGYYWLGLDEKPRKLQPKPAGHEWEISNLTAGRSELRQGVPYRVGSPRPQLGTMALIRELRCADTDERCAWSTEMVRKNEAA